MLASSFDGVPIAYDSVGDGAPSLVFVHGWSCDRSDWDGQLALASRHRVVRVEYAGHGASGRGRSDWTIASFGEDVAAVVRALGLESVVLVGHSMGGDVAVAAASLLGDRVLGIVWVDVYDRLGHDRTPEQVDERMAPFRARFAETVRPFVGRMFAPSADPALVERIVERMATASPDIALPVMRAAWNSHRTIPEALRALRLPVVAINPADGPCDEENLRSFGVDVVRMAGVRHFPMLEDPAGFNRVLTSVVEGFAR